MITSGGCETLWVSLGGTNLCEAVHSRIHHQLETHLLHVRRVEQCREQSNRGLKFHVVFPWGTGGGREEAGGTLQEAVLTCYSIPDNPKIAQPLLLPSWRTELVKIIGPGWVSIPVKHPGWTLTEQAQSCRRCAPISRQDLEQEHLLE